MAEQNFKPQEEERKIRVTHTKVQQNIFRRCHFHILNYENELRECLEKNGGRVLNDMSFDEFKRAARSIESTQTQKVKSEHFILIVEDGDKRLKQFESGVEGIKIVHRRWVEESLKQKKM